MAISQIPALPWELIIWQTKCWQINPPSYGNFTDCCSDSSYFIPTLRAQYLADKVLCRSTPCQMAILQIPVKFLFHSCSKSSTFGRPGLGRSTPLIKGNFTDSCSTLRAHIWQTKFWQIYPLSNGNFTDCSLTAHISFLLWELSFGRPGPDRSTPHQMAILQIPALTAPCSKRSTFDRPGLGRSDPPHQMAISQIPVKFIFHSYSESSTFGWPGLGRSTHPHQMAISQIPALLWKVIFVRPNVGRSTPHPPMVISQMLTDLPPHQTAISQISALLWELIFGRPPCQMVISQILLWQLTSLRAQHLADQVLADLTPPSNGNFSDSCEFIFHSYSESSTFGRPGHGRSIPNQMAISRIPALTAHISWQLIFHSYSESSTFGRPGLGRSTPIWVVISLIPTLTTLIWFLLWELIIWQTRSWHIYPPIQWWFHRFLFWQLTTLRAQHLADQFLADVTPHIRWQIHRFLLYSESSYMADWVLADQHPPSYGNFTDCCSDSSYFIPTLTAQHLADQFLADVTPHIRWQFHRFLLYPESSYLADQVLADQPLNQMAISQIAALTAHISFLLCELNIWQTRSLQIYHPV